MNINTSIVVIFILFLNNKILVEKRKLPEYKNLQILIPGGRIKKGEDIKDALIREMKEELGITPTNYYLLPSDLEIFGLANQTLLPFLIKDWIGDLPEKILDKGNKIEWIEICEVLKTEIKPTKEIVKALIKHLSS